MEIMKEIINSLKRGLSSLDNTMNRMSVNVEENENHFTRELNNTTTNSPSNTGPPEPSNTSSPIHTCGGTRPPEPSNTSSPPEPNNASSPIYTCGGTGGWRRAVYLDMTDPDTNCPSGWNRTFYFKRTCGRSSGLRRTCDSVYFPVGGGEYSQVCGRIKAYQWGVASGFYGYSSNYDTIPMIDSVDGAYFSGVAVLHGSPRRHLWTFAVGKYENYSRSGSARSVCPCDTTYYVSVPLFVGEDYFCESAYIFPGKYQGPSIPFHSNDTLWDGKDCHTTSRCCSWHNPPYFTKNLYWPTTDDIELRMCHFGSISYENTAVELIELYVK